jgi:segregation and condensation protein B
MSPVELPEATDENPTGVPVTEPSTAPAENLPSAPATPGNLKCLVEALLFVAEGPVTTAALARALEVDAEKVDAVLNDLATEYAERGMRLQRVRDKAQLVSAPETAVVVQKFLGIDSSGHLSGPALETLAIIAYRQPVTRPVIEGVRGVNCDGVIHSLLARGLIQEMGRMESAGRPILYGTTFEFLQNFGLRGVDDLPPLEQAAEKVLSAAVEHAQATANAVAERMK